MTELLVIMVVGLLVLGPKRLPELARSLGRGLAEFRRASQDIRRDFLDVQEEARIDPSKAGDSDRAPAGAANAAAPAAEPAAVADTRIGAGDSERSRETETHAATVLAEVAGKSAENAGG